MSLPGLLEQGKTHCYSGLSGWEEAFFRFRLLGRGECAVNLGCRGGRSLPAGLRG